MTGGWADYWVKSHANQETHQETAKVSKVVHI